MPKKKSEGTEKIEPVETIPDERALVFGQLKEQYTMPWEQAARLIRSETMLTEVGVRMAIQVAKSFGLPLQGINLIPSKNGPQVYVNGDGIRWRLHTDPRGLRKSDADVIHRPTKDEPWVESKATIEMGDGSIFVNWGVVYCIPGPDVPNATMKSISKGKRRAGVDSVGVALPIFEDYIEWRGEQGKTIEGEFHIAEKPVDNPTNLAELASWASNKGKTMENVITDSGAEDIAFVMTNFEAVLAKLKEAWK